MYAQYAGFGRKSMVQVAVRIRGMSMQSEAELARFY
ncbi:predicted protein [Sclerotinia sclerotiorum 1980 UF-70]|uniref:Uncharacterized protein n=1 Tax=Sclerotinia sclerotiorum (strain ATCC 18683 / 1980 / Ss-1) TaxID=665079 RepID=A7EBC8_SCLS1|nr:predicted protein [Sclerotinia sclerotiorum 1980 UF-70]EDN99756.1 predicted protein [Sclerotinia sclerotiorum 1980 UF-70]